MAVVDRGARGVALSAVLLLAACNAAPLPSASAPVSLKALPAGTHWALQQSNIDELQAAMPAATLVIEATQLQGSTGCNQYHAGFHFDGEDLSVATPVHTKRACSAVPAKVERAFLEAIAQATSAVRSGDALRLESGDGRWVEFAPAADTAVSKP